MCTDTCLYESKRGPLVVRFSRSPQNPPGSTTRPQSEQCVQPLMSLTAGQSRGRALRGKEGWLSEKGEG